MLPFPCSVLHVTWRRSSPTIWPDQPASGLGRRASPVGPNSPVSAGIRGYPGRQHGPWPSLEATRNARKRGHFR
jgi:hypothetical protein